jgi:tetratricopeptide (TPR) repeat protein
VSEYYQGLEADVAVERGVAYTDKKMYAQAIGAYTRALDFDPRRADVHQRLAELYLKTGDAARAAQQSKEAEKIEKTQ